MHKLTWILVAIAAALLWYPHYGSADTDSDTFLARCKDFGAWDEVTNLNLEIVHRHTTDPNGCSVVTRSKEDFASIRISLEPNFCSRDLGWDDCISDRSRIEIYDQTGIEKGNVINYSLSIFIPEETNLSQNGDPTVFLNQINSSTEGNYSSLVMMEWRKQAGMSFQIHENFDWSISSNITFGGIFGAINQKDRWITLNYEIFAHEKTGYLRIFVDGGLVFEKYDYATIQPGGRIQLKFGIYNYGISRMNEPRSTQVVYFSGIDGVKL